MRRIEEGRGGGWRNIEKDGRESRWTKEEEEDKKERGGLGRAGGRRES